MALGDTIINPATVPYMREERQTVIRAGINLFELRLLRRKEHNQLIFGPIDVKAYEDMDTVANSARFDVEWLTRNDASVKYEIIDKVGNGIAWMPDDRFWHNRLYIMDDSYLYRSLQNLHTRDYGLIPGYQIKAEIDCMRNELKEPVPIHRIFINGIERSYQFTREAAEEEIETMKQSASSIRITPDGNVKAVQAERRKFEIKPGTQLEYRPEIKELIKKYRRKFRFGWTECQTFMEEIKPKIIERIKEKKTEMTGKGKGETASVFSQIMSLPEEEREKLRQYFAPSKPVTDNPENYEPKKRGRPPKPKEVEVVE